MEKMPAYEHYPNASHLITARLLLISLFSTDQFPISFD